MRVFAQDAVPVDYFEGITLDRPFPTTIESGVPILVTGTFEDGFFSDLLMNRVPNRNVKRVSPTWSGTGRFKMWIFFEHEEVGTYAMEWRGGTASLRFSSIAVVRGPDGIPLPSEALQWLSVAAVFEPNVVVIGDKVPSLKVTAPDATTVIVLPPS